MLTKADIRLLVDTFVTRAQFEQTIEQLKEEMVTKDDHRKVMVLVESVYTEVKKMREEQSFHFGMHERIDDEIGSKIGRAHV